MIGFLEGQLKVLTPQAALVVVQGVGYEVRLPLSAYGKLQGQERVQLFIHTYVREDQLVLYGFPTPQERDCFRLLLGVAGVGPRTALAVVSSLTPGELAAAVEGGEWQVLAGVPGVGRRTGERLVVELKGKLGGLTSALPGSMRQDAVSALVNLGYGQKVAEQVVGEVWREMGEVELAQLLREALRRLAR